MAFARYLLVHKPNRDELANVRSIELNIQNITDCRRGRQLLQFAGHAANLALIQDTPSSIEANDLLHSLFARDGDTQEPTHHLKLEQLCLSLEEMWWEDAAEILPGMTDWTCLQSLTMTRLGNLGGLFDILSTVQLNLKGLILVALEGSDDNDSGLYGLLRSFSGLEKLRVSRVESGIGSEAWECNWSSVRQHSATLESLFFEDNATETRLVFESKCNKLNIESFRSLCRDSTQLTQVAVQAGKLARNDHDPAAKLSGIMACLELLPHLVAVRLFVYAPIWTRQEPTLSSRTSTAVAHA